MNTGILREFMLTQYKEQWTIDIWTKPKLNMSTQKYVFYNLSTKQRTLWAFMRTVYQS